MTTTTNTTAATPKKNPVSPIVPFGGVGVQLHHQRMDVHRPGLLRHRQDDLQPRQHRAGSGRCHPLDWRFTDVIDDTIDARVYEGIHFRSVDTQAAGLGKAVARWLDDHYFQPVR